MNIEVARINDRIKNSPQDFIRDSNADYVYRLQKIVDDIAAHHDEKPLSLSPVLQVPERLPPL